MSSVSSNESNPTENELIRAIDELLNGSSLDDLLTEVSPRQINSQRLHRFNPGFPADTDNAQLREPLEPPRPNYTGLVLRGLFRAFEKLEAIRGTAPPQIVFSQPFLHLYDRKYRSSGYTDSNKPDLQELEVTAEAFDGVITINGTPYQFTRANKLITATCDIANYDIQGSRLGIRYSLVTGVENEPVVEVGSASSVTFVNTDDDPLNNMVKIIRGIIAAQ